MGTGGAAGGREDPQCGELSIFTLSNPVVTDQSGDGKVSPGENASITMMLNNISDQDYGKYPRVDLTSDNPNVVPNGTQFYAAFAHGSYQADCAASFGSNIALGTTVHFTAQVQAMDLACASTHKIEFDVTVE